MLTIKYLCILTILAPKNLLLTNGTNILCIFQLPLISHQKPLRNLAKELSLRGHYVTQIVTNPLMDKNLTNLTEIDISSLHQYTNKKNIGDFFTNEPSALDAMIESRSHLDRMAEVILNNKEVQDLINSDHHFDLVIVEAHDPVFFAFGAKFNAPIIAISTLGVLLEIHTFVGNPAHPILAPDIFMPHLGSEDLSFIQRLYGLYYNVYYRLLLKWKFLPKMDETVKKYFGKNMPPLEDIISTISLVITNTNPVLNTVRPNIPVMVEVGHLHIEKSKALPTDIQEYLDNSKNGVVYFSLGTNFLCSNLRNESLEIITEALGALPFNVLWKFENEELPRLSQNVYTKKWFPQQDVLGHPNVKVFLTQGGIQSIEEAIINEVPMVGMPLGVDQPKNVRALIKWGAALGINFREMNSEMLRTSIIKVATDPSFKENVKRCKKILEDQPFTGVDKAIWWIEYVLRHKGTRHLQYPGADMPLYQYLMLDVITFVLLVFTLVTVGIFKMFFLLSETIVSRKPKTD